MKISDATPEQPEGKGAECSPGEPAPPPSTPAQHYLAAHNGCATQEWQDGFNTCAAAPAAPVVDDARCGSERYELDAYIWKRESTQEWVLEISGEVGGASFISRHSEPLTTPPEDVAGLPSLYAALSGVSAPNRGLNPPPERERDMLAEAIRNAAVKRGIVREDASLTGPMLLLLCEDLAQEPRAPVGVEGTWLWCKLMDWCREQRIDPATQNKLFAIADEAHRLNALTPPAAAPRVECVACEGKPAPENNPCAVCGRAASEDGLPNPENGDFDCPKAAAMRTCPCGFCAAIRRLAASGQGVEL